MRKKINNAFKKALDGKMEYVTITVLFVFAFIFKLFYPW